jgi:type I restriction enzyme M protein
MNKAERHPLKKALWRACDVMRRDDNCNGARDYVEHLTWLLLLKFLDRRESLFGNNVDFTDERYHWRNWVPKFIGTQLLQDSSIPSELSEMELMKFVKNELIPYLATLSGTAEQEVIASVFVDRNTVVCNSPRNLKDLIRIIDNLDFYEEDSLHSYAEFYEELLQRLSTEDISSGEFLVPSALAHFIVQILNPIIGETVYDPSCGSGTFLVEAHRYLRSQEEQIEKTGRRPKPIFVGLERKPVAALIGSLNLILNGLSRAQIRRQNALEPCDSDIPQHFDVVITNPPFGLNSSANNLQTGQGQRKASEVLFVEHIMDKLRPRDGARCAMIVSDGVLFRPGYFEKARKKLTEQFNISLIVSLPSGCFPYTAAKTSIIFFNLPGPTTEILYYEVATSISKKKANKKRPLSDGDFDQVYETWNRWQAYLRKEESRPALPESSWTVSLDQIRVRNYDLCARPNNRIGRSDSNSSTAELLSQLAADGRELTLAVDRLFKLFNQNGEQEY